MRAKQRASLLLDILKYNSMMRRLFTEYFDESISYYLKIKLPVNYIFKFYYILPLININLFKKI